jgi:hypothetical protein
VKLFGDWHLFAWRGGAGRRMWWLAAVGGGLRLFGFAAVLTKLPEVRDIVEHLGETPVDSVMVARPAQGLVRLPLLNDRTSYTCHDCVAQASCPWAFDDYNQGGDCLAEK